MNYSPFVYLPILIFLIIGILLGGLLVVISSILVSGSQDTEKRMPYECGFESFGDARISFDVRFYLVTLLFIIFDLEIAFLFPWAITFKKLGLLGFWSMMVFLFILTIGFIYEWNKGALEWE